MNHSIADAFMFAIRTPIGIIMHSGDFKIDYTPINGAIMDLQRIAQIGREGVLLFVCESTNIEVPGFSKSERHVGESMADMFKDAKGRIFVATFSSNVSRLQQIFTAAERHGRSRAGRPQHAQRVQRGQQSGLHSEKAGYADRNLRWTTTRRSRS